MIAALILTTGLAGFFCLGFFFASFGLALSIAMADTPVIQIWEIPIFLVQTRPVICLLAALVIIAPLAAPNPLRAAMENSWWGRATARTPALKFIIVALTLLAFAAGLTEAFQRRFL